MRTIIHIFCFLLVLFLGSEEVRAEPNVSANNAIVMDMQSGEVIYDKRASEERPIASITKIMTAILAIESGKMDEQAIVSRNAIYTEGSSIYLEQGETMKLKDLVYGLMLRSGNDAAITIAEHIGGSEEGFTFLMNEKATWLGMNHTHFENPHGLDAETHYSSAYDMAVLTQYAMDNGDFAEISNTPSYKSANKSYSWQNKHRLVNCDDSLITGGKTGFTKKTGRTLVTTAEKDGMEVVVVTLNGPDDWNDHQILIEWGLDKLTANRESAKNEVENLPVQAYDASYSFHGIVKKLYKKIAGVKP